MKNHYIALINTFVQDLTVSMTIDEIVWNIAKNVISQLDLIDCVIYLYNEERTYLVQRAAYGPKNPIALDIINPIIIYPGQGIVGSVAISKKAEIVGNTKYDARYIVDDCFRLSEIAVPILHDDEVIGVIDSEHQQENFFTGFHLEILNTIAAIAANKIVQAQAMEALAKGTILLQEKNEALSKVNQEMDKFIHSTSHDLRTPITAIKGLVQLIQMKETGAEVAHFVSLIGQSAERMDDTIVQIMNFAYNRESEVHYQFYHFEQGIKAIFDSISQAKALKLLFEIPTDFAFYTDIYRIELIIKHLLLNSSKFTRNSEEESFILISAEEREIDYLISFKDNGEGIDNQHLDKIFNMFYRASHKSNGAGLGLFLCKEMVKILKGEIYVESEKNVGTTFFVRLPKLTTIPHHSIQ